VWWGTIGQAVERAAAVEPRGEYVLVVTGASSTEPTDDDIVTALKACEAAGADRKQAVAQVTRDLGVAKRRVYDLAHGPRTGHV